MKQYFKFSDERNKKFSIQTEFANDNKKQYVLKTSIYKEGEQHINNIFSYYQLLKDAYPNVTICPVEKKENILFFDYIEGTMLLDEYEDCMIRMDRKSFAKLLEKHADIICGKTENQAIFHETIKSKEWFGDLKDWEGKPALLVANFDATPNNIVMNSNGATFIDYEWVFDCRIPKNLVVFHCIRDAYLHLSKLEKFVPLSEAMHILDIEESVEMMDESYHKFYEHVVEEKNGLSFAKKKFECLKEMKTLPELREDYMHALSEWEMCANNWKLSSKENERLNLEIATVRHEWEVCANNWRGSCDENNRVNEKLAEASREWKKYEQYWKDSCENQRRNYREEKKYLENETRLEARIAQLEKDSSHIIHDKDVHIGNIESMLEKQKQDYDKIINSKRWRIVQKAARLFGR